MFAYLGLHADFAFLDDTGADIPSVFELDDLPLLGIVCPGPWWSPMIPISTTGDVIHDYLDIDAVDLRAWQYADKPGLP